MKLGPYCLLNITIVVVVIFKQVQYMFYLNLLLKKYDMLRFGQGYGISEVNYHYVLLFFVYCCCL